jgi:hypothetical protein
MYTLPSTIQQHKSNVGTQLTYLPGFTYMFTACVCTPGTSTMVLTLKTRTLARSMDLMT